MNLRILHLEDNVRDSELMQELLTEHGLVCQVTRVDTRDDFSAALDRCAFDLIVSDFSLPSFDGRSGLAIAHEKAPQVPFIFLSGTMGEDAAIEALKSGATDYVLKYRVARFVPVVSRALAEARERARRLGIEAALQAAEERFRGIFESSKDAIIYADLRGRLIDVNHAAVALLGYGQEELLTRTEQDISVADHHDNDVAKSQAIVRTGEAAEYETEFVRKGGTRIPVSLTRFVVRGSEGRPVGLATIVRDITERKTREERILELAYHDPLTGLPNRRLFSDRLELSLSQVRRNRRALAVMVLDLDGFKVVNDMLGHAKGDVLLQQVGTRLRTAVRSGDTVARLGEIGRAHV